MTFHEDIAGLKDRIAQAEAEREAWRIAGVEERYLHEAYRPMSLIAFLLNAFVSDSTVEHGRPAHMAPGTAVVAPAAAFGRHINLKELRP